MSKYDVRICSCGRIHFVPNEMIDEAIENNKNLLLVCGGCGTATMIGADVRTDWDDPTKTVYDMYAWDVSNGQDKVWDASMFEATENKKAVSKIFRSEGVQVMMETGYYAKSYNSASGQFMDIWYPDFYKIQREGITAEEILQLIAEWEKAHVTVNMNTLLRHLSDEQAEALSGYVIEGLDWKGTKFQKKWHK